MSDINKHRSSIPEKSHSENQHPKTYLTDFRSAFFIMAFQILALLAMQGITWLVAVVALEIASMVIMYFMFEVIQRADALSNEAERKEKLGTLVYLFYALGLMQAAILVLCAISCNIVAVLLTLVTVVIVAHWMNEHIEVNF